MRVKVYYNLRKKCLSVMSDEGCNKGLVIGHTQSVSLTDVFFKVSQSGRKRVLEQKRKNVHAFICGTLSNEYLGYLDTVVSYNPYKYSSFVLKDSEQPIYSATKATINGKSILIG